jgi:hypothetical protein
MQLLSVQIDSVVLQKFEIKLLPIGRGLRRGGIIPLSGQRPAAIEPNGFVQRRVPILRDMGIPEGKHRFQKPLVIVLRSVHVFGKKNGRFKAPTDGVAYAVDRDAGGRIEKGPLSCSV